MRFVIADDVEVPRLVAKRIVRNAGHEVVALAKNGAEAVELCERLRPDVVVLDVLMPVLAGDVAARRVLNAGLVRGVIMASSNSQDGIVNPLLEIGCRFVTKPFRTDDLVRAIREIESGLA